MKLSRTYTFTAPFFPVGSREELEQYLQRCVAPQIKSFHLKISVNVGHLFDERAGIEATLDGMVVPLMEFLQDRLLNYVMRFPTMENILLFFPGYLNRVLDGRVVTQLEFLLCDLPPDGEELGTMFEWDSRDTRDHKFATSGLGWRPPKQADICSGQSLLPEIPADSFAIMLTEFRDAKRRSNNAINDWRTGFVIPLIQDQVKNSGAVKMGKPPTK
jgi:hypothetical protein